jgi:hypothetical protein
MQTAAFEDFQYQFGDAFKVSTSHFNDGQSDGQIRRTDRLQLDQPKRNHRN